MRNQKLNKHMYYYCFDMDITEKTCSYACCTCTMDVTCLSIVLLSNHLYSDYSKIYKRKKN